jgi:hypothetical protein
MKAPSSTREGPPAPEVDGGRGGPRGQKAICAHSYLQWNPLKSNKLEFSPGLLGQDKGVPSTVVGILCGFAQNDSTQNGAPNTAKRGGAGGWLDLGCFFRAGEAGDIAGRLVGLRDGAHVRLGQEFYART